MHRLLIVDDEPYIVEGLVQLFQELELGLDVCKAFSAVEAVEWIRKTKVDIVISDIRMPEKSGLQLIDDLMFYWPACKIIFLTGYDEFDYVYSAIKKNADHYILKTEDDSVLIDAVKQCIQKIEEEARNRSMMETVSRQMTLMGPLLKKELYEAILFGENLKGIVWDENLEQQSLKLDKQSPVLLVVCRVEGWGEEMTYGEKLNAYFSIQALVEEQIAHTVHCESFVFQHSRVVWFIQPNPNETKFVKDEQIDWRSLSAYLKGKLESVQDSFRAWSDAGVSFVISRAAVHMSELHKEFELMSSFMKKRYSFGSSMSVIDLALSDGIWANEAEAPTMNAFEFKKKLGKLESSLDEGNEIQLEASCRELIQHIRSQADMSYFTCAEQYYTFLLVFLREMNSGNMEESFNSSLYLEQLKMTEIPDDWETALVHILQLGKRICAHKRSLRELEENALIRNVHSYINDNLSSDLSLVRIADAMFFNPSYLSRYYKQHTGHNLSEHIHTARLDAAKQLLSNPNLKVHEIAEKLGFNSPSYFTIFFRKMTGKSPQEYREELAGRLRK